MISRSQRLSSGRAELRQQGLVIAAQIGMSFRIGIVSDTHGFFDPTLERLFEGVDLILHAGDICGEEVLQALERLAPVVAISGNCDKGYRTSRLPEWRLKEFRGIWILLVHNLKNSSKRILESRPQIVVSGHSHKPHLYEQRGTLFVNPGSSGKRRFRLPRTAGLITLKGQNIDAQIVSIDEASLPEVEELSFSRQSRAA